MSEKEDFIGSRLSVNEREFEVLKLLGKGKGGYS